LVPHFIKFKSRKSLRPAGCGALAHKFLAAVDRHSSFLPFSTNLNSHAAAPLSSLSLSRRCAKKALSIVSHQLPISESRLK